VPRKVSRGARGRGRELKYVRVGWRAWSGRAPGPSLAVEIVFHGSYCRHHTYGVLRVARRVARAQIEEGLPLGLAGVLVKQPGLQLIEPGGIVQHMHMCTHRFIHVHAHVHVYAQHTQDCMRMYVHACTRR